MTFGIFFPLFHKYWDIVSKRGTEHTSLEVEILTSHLFILLKIECDNSKWDSEELKHICYALDAKLEDVNPNYFIRKEFAYFEHVKT